jgi:hypothetical protein
VHDDPEVARSAAMRVTGLEPAICEVHTPAQAAVGLGPQPAAVGCGHYLGPLPCVNPAGHDGGGRGCVHHSESGVPDRHDRGAGE